MNEYHPPGIRAADPLPFMDLYRPIEKREGVHPLDWLDYEPGEKVVWPDLGSYGVEIVLAAMPSGRVFDVVRNVRPDASRQHGEALHRLGFQPKETDGKQIWIRPHKPVRVEDFVKQFSETRAAELSLDRIILPPPGWTMKGATDFSTGPLPTEKEFRDMKLWTTLELEPGLVWVPIRADTAVFAACAARSSVPMHVVTEHNANGGRSPPHIWYMLARLTDDGTVRGEVIVAAPGPGARFRKIVQHVSPVHIVGFGDSNPYPEWACEIAALARRIGRPLPPSYAGNPVESKVATLVGLLDTYGRTRFGKEWLARKGDVEAREGVTDILHRARIGHLDDGDWNAAISPFVIYGDERFGQQWCPYKEAEDFLGEERGAEMKKLLDWVDAQNAADMDSRRRAIL